MLAEAVSQVLLDLIYLVVLATISLLAPRVMAWYTTHTNAQIRALLASLAAAAVPHIERQFPGLPGVQQFYRAVDQVVEWLGERKIRVTTQEIEAEIQRAYASAKASGALDAAKPKAEQVAGRG